MSGTHRRASGFTIAELLIVIVIIGILAAITIVAYSNIQSRAKTSALMANIKQAATKVKTLTDAEGGYPMAVSASQFPASAGVTYNYRKVNDGFCVDIVDEKNGSYFMTNDFGPSVGPCPIGYWPLDGDARDVTPHGNDGIVVGATLTNDRFNNPTGAYQLGASSQHIKIPDAPILTNRTSGFSYSLWVMRTGTSSSQWPQVFGSNDTHSGYGIRSHSYGNNLGFESGNPPFSGASFSNVGTVAYAGNEWQMVTVTYDGTAVRQYWNGELRSQGNRQLKPSNAGLGIGQASGGFVAKADDARIYDRALSPVEVRQLFEAK